MRRLWPQPRKSEFSPVADAGDAPGATNTPALTATHACDAARALTVLWQLCDANLAKPYQPHMDHSQWMMWLEITQRRVELRVWVREWLAAQEPKGGDAA